MLFRPPDLHFYHLDRLSFLFLVFVVVLRALVIGQSFQFAGLVIGPCWASLCSLPRMFSLNLEVDLWSAFAARWLVPFGFYCLSQLIFQDNESAQRIETFSLIALAYLSGIAVFFLVGLHSFIFPAFILDESLGIHADRARGPFLQAVANGVTLNLLGLIALNAFRRERLRGGLAFLLLASLPVAILATKTRAVWLSFALSILAAPLVSRSRRVRQACMAIVLVSSLAVLLALNSSGARAALTDRLSEQSPVAFRASLYEAGLADVSRKALLRMER